MREMNHFSLTHFTQYLASLLLSFLMSGCVIPLYFEYLHWTIELTKVEKSSDAERIYGVLRKLGTGTFEDGLVKVDAETKDPMQAFFVLTNKTQHDLKIDWRKAKFVDIYGQTHPVDVMPLRQPGIENLSEGHTRDDGTLTELKHAQSARIRVSPPGRPQIRRLSAWEIPGMTGKTFEVLLPLQVENKNYEYVFTFQITHLRTGT